jgi:HEAT repeat protein
VGKFLAFIVFIAGLAIAAAWYSQQGMNLWPGGPSAPATAGVSEEWLEHIYSQNPRDAATAEQEVRELGARALPAIRAVLRDPGSDTDLRKAALKGCVVLEQAAAAAIPDVAVHLPDPELTAEAALALSLMGREAFGPLREALAREDPVVRREALRSIGKLKTRAPLDTGAVLPLLIAGMQDRDKGVRTVAATYLGILHEDPERAVPALVSGLADDDVEVRRASATALGSFERGTEEALPELRKAARDRDEDLAREAGLALVKLQKQ